MGVSDRSCTPEGMLLDDLPNPSNVSQSSSVRSARVVLLDWNPMEWIFLIFLPQSEDSTSIDVAFTSNLCFFEATKAHSNNLSADGWRNSHGTPGGCLDTDVADASGVDVELLAVDTPHKQQLTGNSCQKYLASLKLPFQSFVYMWKHKTSTAQSSLTAGCTRQFYEENSCNIFVFYCI